MPRGSQRRMYSAPTIASAKLFSVRLSVAAIISPPGLTIAAQLATNSADVGDMLDHFHRQHDVERSLRREVLGGGGAVIDSKAALLA